MGKLTDILAAGGFGGDDFNKNWNKTDVAGEFSPLPPGEYVCHAERGELRTAKKGTPSYLIVFKIIEGEFAGRPCWHDLYLTPAALPMAKRDLLKLGIDSPEKLERPLPPGIRCRVRVVLRKDDYGNETNHVRRFDVIGIDELTVDPFAPDGTEPEGGDDGQF
jgi:hypothetical protein